MAIDPIKLSLCKKFYIEHNGRHHDEIQRLMRESGYATFTTRCLYRGNGKPGYIERFGWRDQLRNADCGSRIEEEARRTGLRKTQTTEHTESTEQTTNPHSAIRDPQFESWLKKVSSNYTWHWPYQQYIYKQLEKVTSGECKRLMIFMPPRHGKSELVTVRYAAWRLSQDPGLNIILGSYNQKLANRFSRKIRNVYSEAQEKLAADARVPTADKPTTDSQEGGFTPALRSAEDGGGKPPFRTASNDIDPMQAPAVRIKRANTAEEWELPAGGGVRAVGVGAGITGFGAKLVIIDDPVKSRAEAESPTYRRRLSDWFNDDIYTRLEPDAAVILIQTRWHEDDLAGRLLKDMHDGGEQWEVISFPALAEAAELRNADCGLRNEESRSVRSLHSVVNNCQISDTTEHTESKSYAFTREPDAADTQRGITPEGVTLTDPLHRLPGEPLCPERFNTEALERIKRRLGSYSFAALYQQRPSPLDGGLFKRSWFKTVSHAPKGLKWKRGYDLALSTKTSADYTASFRCALSPQGALYIDGGFRKRIEFPEQKKYILDKMRNEPDTEHGIESALHGAAFVQELRRTPGFLNRAFRAIRVEGDKFTRALTWANRAEEGSLYLVRGPWNDTFIDEACSFPHSPHDDQIDAISIAVHMLTRKKHTACSF
jgi:predicted phage terminase large subunit-like protein